MQQKGSGGSQLSSNVVSFHFVKTNCERSGSWTSRFMNCEQLLYSDINSSIYKFQSLQETSLYFRLSSCGITLPHISSVNASHRHCKWRSMSSGMQYHNKLVAELIVGSGLVCWVVGVGQTLFMTAVHPAHPPFTMPSPTLSAVSQLDTRQVRGDESQFHSVAGTAHIYKVII